MDIDERVRELIGRMSIEEKIAQLISIPPRECFRWEEVLCREGERGS